MKQTFNSSTSAAAPTDFAPEDGGAGGTGDGGADAEKVDDKTGDEGVPNVSELEAALAAAKAKETKLAAALAALQGSLKRFDGIDPDQVRTLLKQQRDAELAAAEAKGEFDKVKEMMAQQHQAELEGYKVKMTEFENMVARLNGTVNELTVGAAFDGSNFIKENLVLTPSKARVIYGPHFESEDGKVVAYDKPRGQDGRTKLVDARGQTLGFEDAIKMLVEKDPDKDRLLKSSMKNGAGSKTTDAPPEQDQKEVFGRERIALGLATLRKG